MDEYAKGVFECLSWVESMMNDLEKGNEKWEELRGEVQATMQELKQGMSGDFRNRLRARF